jgi:hypothetical protein
MEKLLLTHRANRDVQYGHVCSNQTCGPSPSHVRLRYLLRVGKPSRVDLRGLDPPSEPSSPSHSATHHSPMRKIPTDMDNYERDAHPTTDGDERPSKRRRHTTTALYPPREVGLMRSVPGDKISSFVGSSSGVYFIRSVYSALRSHPNTAAPIPSPEVPGEDDHLPSASPNVSKRIWRSNEVSPQGSPAITFQKLVTWSRSYFSNWHPAYPFLHAPAILAFFERLSQGQDTREPSTSTSDPEFIILRAIMSISLADRRQSPSDNVESYPAELVFQSYDEASNSVQHAFSQPVSMQSLQAALSVQLFLVSMLRFNAASRLGGLVIRMALQMGLHRCPQRYPSFSSAQRELRHRVFFSLYCIDRFICQSTGLPLSLRDDDIDGEQLPFSRKYCTCINDNIVDQSAIQATSVTPMNSLPLVIYDPLYAAPFLTTSRQSVAIIGISVTSLPHSRRYHGVQTQVHPACPT